MPHRYATFEVVCEEGDNAAYGDGRTEALLGAEDPIWEAPVLLILPAGSHAAHQRRGRPRVRVSVYDKDRANADELLGTTELLLTADSGQVANLRMSGVGPFPDFAVSFEYASERVVPSPAATLRISDIVVVGLDAAAAGLEAGGSKRGVASPTRAATRTAPRTASKAASKAAPSRAAVKAVAAPRQHQLCFRLLEAATTREVTTPSTAECQTEYVRVEGTPQSHLAAHITESETSTTEGQASGLAEGASTITSSLLTPSKSASRLEMPRRLDSSRPWLPAEDGTLPPDDRQMLERCKYDSVVQSKLDEALMKVEAMKDEGNDGVAGDVSIREGDEDAAAALTAAHVPLRPSPRQGGMRRARMSKDAKEAAAYAAIGGTAELAGSLAQAHVWAGLQLDLDLPIGSVRPPLLNIELRDLVPAESDSGPVALEDVRLDADETGLVELKLSGAAGRGVNVRFRFELMEVIGDRWGVGHPQAGFRSE